MKVFDLHFTDGKSCRCIIPEPESDADELSALRDMFGADRLESMRRIIAPPPEKLPWKRQSANLWTLGLFALSKLPDGSFHCFWPGGEVSGGKEDISAAVRQHWSSVA